jgi:hypothetical protein
MFSTFKISTLLFLLSCNSPEKQSNSKQPIKTNTQQISASSFDTLPNGLRLLDNLDSGMHIYYKEVVGSDTLKGGYITCYGIDDSIKYFYLRHGNRLYLLNKTPTYTSTWSLGTLEKDFTTFFMTRIDNGNGVPETYQIFDKHTGNNILGDNVKGWNYQYFDDTLFMLYENHTVNLIGNYIDRKKADSIFLYNVESKNRKGYKLPKDIPYDIYFNLKKLTKNSLTISYIKIMSDEKEKLIKYNR